MSGQVKRSITLRCQSSSFSASSHGFKAEGGWAEQALLRSATLFPTLRINPAGAQRPMRQVLQTNPDAAAWLTFFQESPPATEHRSPFQWIIPNKTFLFKNCNYYDAVSQSSSAQSQRFLKYVVNYPISYLSAFSRQRWWLFQNTSEKSSCKEVTLKAFAI